MWHTLQLKNQLYIVRIDHQLVSGQFDKEVDFNSYATIYVSDFKQLWSERLQVSKLLDRWKVRELMMMGFRSVF